MERLAHMAKVGLGAILAAVLFAIVAAVYIRGVTYMAMHRSMHLLRRRLPGHVQ